MDFLKLVHKREQKGDNKIIFGLIGLLFLIGLFFAVVNLLPAKEYQPLLSYLPQNVNFYYHFTDKNTFDQDILGDLKLFDNTIASNRINSLRDILGPSFLNAKEIVWFKTESSDKDNYLLRFSHFQKNVFEDLEKSHPDMYFLRLDNETLLISDSQEVYNQMSSQTVSGHFASDNNKGIDMYWRLGKSADFLDYLIPYLSTVFKSGEAHANFYRQSKNNLYINLYGFTSSDKEDDLAAYRSPLDPDFVLAFSKYTPQELKNSIESDLIRSIFDSLPYYNINSQVIEEAILDGGVIWQKDDSWIIATPIDSSAVILDLVDYYQVKEKKNTLKDGTLYTELVADDNPNKIEYNYKDKNYFQISNIFIFQDNNINYLTNNETFILEMIDSDQKLSNLWQDCQQNGYKASDFIYLDTNKLPKGGIKDYLESKAINKLKMSAYFSEKQDGIQICL